MLVLMRRVKQRLTFSHPDGVITVEVSAIERTPGKMDKVKLAIDAPQSVRVLRGELCE